MATLPHDISDLYLAPVVLALDGRIEELGKLDAEALAATVALDSDRPDRSRYEREAGLLAAVGYLIDRQGWELSWDPRGIRLTHGKHALVLGVPGSFTEFLAQPR
jgi:hypothetical protein